MGVRGSKEPLLERSVCGSVAIADPTPKAPGPNYYDGQSRPRRRRTAPILRVQVQLTVGIDPGKETRKLGSARVFTIRMFHKSDHLPKRTLPCASNRPRK